MADDRRARAADLRLGLVAVALAAVALLWLIPTYVRAPIAPRPLAMAPWFLPGIAASLFGLAGGALAVSAWRRGRASGDGHDPGGALPGDPPPDGPPPGEPSEGPPGTTAPSVTSLQHRGLATVLAALLAWLLLMPLVGAPATAAVVTLALLLRDPTISRTVAFAVGLVVPLLAWLAFTRLAGTPLPTGVGPLPGL